VIADTIGPLVITVRLLRRFPHTRNEGALFCAGTVTGKTRNRLRLKRPVFNRATYAKPRWSRPSRPATTPPLSAVGNTTGVGLVEVYNLD